MKREADRWVIKLESEQIKGPYSTEAVRKMIGSGVFTGNEEICTYPEGEWKSLNKQPEFYEALLESLENPVEVDSKKAQRMDAETVIRVPSRETPKIPDVNNELQDSLKKILENQVDQNKNSTNSKLRKTLVTSFLVSVMISRRLLLRC